MTQGADQPPRTILDCGMGLGGDARYYLAQGPACRREWLFIEDNARWNCTQIFRSRLSAVQICIYARAPVVLNFSWL